MASDFLMLHERPNAPDVNRLPSTDLGGFNGQTGIAVRTYRATVADAGDTPSFLLVSGPGDAGKPGFSIAGNELKLTSAADFETQSSYTVRVRATDAGTPGLAVEQSFVITVNEYA